LGALFSAQRADLWIVGRPFDAAVPRLIIIVAILVILAVGFVVLVVVADEIVQREAIVRGDEVDRRPGFAAAALEEVGRGAQPRRQRRGIGEKR